MNIDAANLNGLIQATLDHTNMLTNTVGHLTSELLKAEELNAKLIEERDTRKEASGTTNANQEVVQAAQERFSELLDERAVGLQKEKYQFAESIVMQIKVALGKIHVESVGEKYMLPCHDVMYLVDKALLDLRVRKIPG